MKLITRSWKWIVTVLIILFVLMNVVAIFHSYKLTHFSDSGLEKTKNPEKLSTGQKVSVLIFGVNNPRPSNSSIPQGYETIYLKSNKKIECWYHKSKNSKGTAILFHGYSGHKSSLLDKAAIFEEQGLNILLVDFMGSGGSEGNQTTIGFEEAKEVKSCYDFIRGKGEKKIILFGTSMGAVAIMKAVNDFKIVPEANILECPFGTMYETVCARFKTMNAPIFPMAGLLVFWGGVQNGFWGFSHNPEAYATTIASPALLMYGGKDEKVSKNETDLIFSNLKGKKKLTIFKEAAHENYLRKYKVEWTKDVAGFLSSEHITN